MNELPGPSDEEVTSAPPKPPVRMGLGTVSILVLFFGIITAMCIGAIFIVVVLAFK